jgi:hypothetical protein
VDWDRRRALTSVPGAGKNGTGTINPRSEYERSATRSSGWLERFFDGRYARGNGKVPLLTALVAANCPRCGADQITFDVHACIPVGMEYRWQRWYEAFGVCRNCLRGTIFLISQKTIQDRDFLDQHSPLEFRESLNLHFDVDRWISLRDRPTEKAPEYVPEAVKAAFEEGAACLSIKCFNAAGAMFRMCLDLATRPMLPKEEVEGLNARIRRDLGLRLPWMFDHGKLPEALRELSHCIREDGNDAAHAGNLTQHDAEDLIDFARVLLERLYTEPERLRLAQQRREKRRDKR